MRNLTVLRSYFSFRVQVRRVAVNAAVLVLILWTLLIHCGALLCLFDGRLDLLYNMYAFPSAMTWVFWALIRIDFRVRNKDLSSNNLYEC